MEEKIRQIRKEIYDLFREDTDERRYSYVRKNWIFPNHLDVMIKLVNDMCPKYGGDVEVCEIAVYLHDVGLVYKRDSPSPEGHESRSIEYAKMMMDKYNISEKQRDEIIGCIEATDASECPKGVNQRIVRTADALSQFVSVHFFAKAAFSGDWESYKKWLKKKATNNFKKICFEDEIAVALPIRDYILNGLDMYGDFGSRYPLSE